MLIFLPSEGTAASGEAVSVEFAAIVLVSLWDGCDQTQGALKCLLGCG